MSDYPMDVPSDAPGYNFFRPIPWSKDFQERFDAVSHPTISMDYDKAFGAFYDEFSDWLMKNEFVCNGDMLTELMESPDKFEEFIADKHPEIGELT